jgi:hypothetical protein
MPTGARCRSSGTGGAVRPLPSSALVGYAYPTAEYKRTFHSREPEGGLQMKLSWACAKSSTDGLIVSTPPRRFAMTTRQLGQESSRESPRILAAIARPPSRVILKGIAVRAAHESAPQSTRRPRCGIFRAPDSFARTTH